MQRKTVTVLFCDVVGSTALGESVDPERLRGLLVRYFERMKGIVELHGGTVEKFIGDAVVAVFGVPVAHEDDALRAVRAAAAMRAALPQLGIEARIGVTTGEVVAGSEERLATGDALNVAARLEQAAPPGEVLIGEPTLALLDGAAEVEPVAPLALKGKAEPVAAYRLLALHEVPERRFEERFVGREEELALIAANWERALAGQGCELVTIVGEAGVGKSRLVAEALRRIDARAVQGRCLPYGEGITYWPVVEVLKQLRVLPTDPAAAAPLRALLRESDEATSGEEIAWAFRRLLEQEAPLLVVFDDIQWGEETLLDLLEGTALLSTGAPLLLLCLARPELLDRRPRWPGTLRLKPLPDQQVHELVGERVTPGLRERIAGAAGGNPLFVLEMLAMTDHRDGDEVTVPPTLRALLAARLDQLDEPERRVLERGAVEGEVFHRGAVLALAPEEAHVSPRLAALVRRELIRPDKPVLAGEEAFRFRHLLVRDAAYESVPKSLRAELHERFADWLEQHGRSLVELDELLGYHLEQAACYRLELNPRDQRVPELAMRAEERLASAGRRALDRGDAGAAKLLGRALALTAADHDQLALRLALARALALAGDAIGARAAAAVAASLAATAGDRRGELLARLQEITVTAIGGAEPRVESLAFAREALSYFEQLDDDEGLANAWFAVANCDWYLSQYGRGLDACRRARKHARRAGLTHIYRAATVEMSWMLFAGPTPVREALRWLQDTRQVEASVPLQQGVRAASLARIGRFDDARAVIGDAVERSEQLGGTFLAGIEALYWPEVERLAGDLAAAERHLRRGCEMFELAGAEGYLSTFLCFLADVLCELGHDGEAEELTRRGEQLGARDLDTQRLWRQVRARILARRGEWQQAERLAREAVALAEQTDAPVYRGDALAALAEVLATADRTEEAAATLERALAEYEQKGVLPLVERTRERLAELRPAAPAPVEA